MAKWKKPKRTDPHQLTIGWSESVTVPVASLATASTIDSPAELTDNDSNDIALSGPSVAQSIRADKPLSRQPELMQRLPWDFTTTFPYPLPNAIETGVIREEDTEPEQIRSMHHEYARHLGQVLTEQDGIAAARRLGIDPKTRVKPETRAGKERLKRFFQSEPLNLQRTWEAIVGAYEDCFGKEAADAFAKAIQARHAGIGVAAESGKQHASNVGNPSGPDPAREPAPSGGLGILTQGKRNQSTHVIARLPLPRPLRHAVMSGQFGHDEYGPVNPSSDEVRDITLNHAEKVIDLIEVLHEAKRRGLAERNYVQHEERLQQAIADYAEDFGQRAGEQLLAYCLRQVRLNHTTDAQAERGR